MEEIFVTGMGILSGLGRGTEATLSALRAGRSAVGPMRWLETVHRELPVAEVPLSDGQMAELLGLEPGGVNTRTALMGAIAARDAMAMARFGESRPGRVALVSGTTVGGMEKTEACYAELLAGEGCGEYADAHDCGACTAAIAGMCGGGFDMATTISTACSSAANALIFGADLIRTGRAEAAVVGGSECLTRFHLNGFNTLMILDREPCRPFDASRAGLNLGEGAAYLVLESAESVRRRGVEPLCRLSGYGNACDAYHQTASSPDGDGAYIVMKKALEMSGLRPEDIDYVNAHGTGTPNNDLSEGRALMRLFGEGGVPPVSSTKAFTGHTTSASGGVEAVISILAMREGFLPVNLRFGERIEGLSFDPVTNPEPRGEIRHVMNNSFGFGGNDTSCIFSKLASRH